MECHIQHFCSRAMFSTRNNPASAFGSFGQLPAFSIPPEVPKVKTHSERFMGSIARLFNDANYSDATVSIYDVVLPVHKLIICTQSEYFEKAFQERFVEGNSGTISFGEDSGAAYWRVFEYMYTGDYFVDLSTNNFEDDPILLKDPRVYVLADMFLLEDLKALSTIKLQEKLKELWMSDSFPECIREIYASISDSKSKMRLVVVEIATAHAHELGKKEVFNDLLREGGDFAADYVGALTKAISMR